MDLRFEAVYTNTPTRNPSNFGGQYIYWELFYHDLYTNKKNIIGNWIGRDGQGFQSWSKYWFSPRNTLNLGVPTNQFMEHRSLSRQDEMLSTACVPVPEFRVFRWTKPILAPRLKPLAIPSDPVSDDVFSYSCTSRGRKAPNKCTVRRKLLGLRWGCGVDRLESKIHLGHSGIRGM